jgi:molybdenum cofactor guanylyltransferase
MGASDPPGATGFVVAGGASRRMGRDKALLPWGRATLLDHTLARLAACCDEVRILCGSRTRYAERGVPLVLDRVPGAGPLGGVLSGLETLDGELGLFLAVDLPSVGSALLKHLLKRAGGHDAVVPRSPQGPEPLCAVYRRTCLPAIRRRVASGDLKMTSFYAEVRVLEIDPEELRAFGDPNELFRNLNTAADYSGSVMPAAGDTIRIPGKRPRNPVMSPRGRRR